MSELPVVVDARNRYLQRYGPTFQSSFHCGQVALGLELETRARIVEGVGSSAFEVSVATHIASTLRDLLSVVGIRDDVLDEYERQVRDIRTYGADDAADSIWTPASGAEPDVSQPDSASSDAPAPALHNDDPQTPSSVETAVTRARLLADADASSLVVDNETSLEAPFSVLELTSEGEVRVSPAERISRERSTFDRELPYGDEGRMDEE